MLRLTPDNSILEKVSDLGVDMLTLVGHKFGAPKGVAALFVRKGLALPPMIHGGGQEAGRRAGTENVLLISGMGKAAEVGKADVRDRMMPPAVCWGFRLFPVVSWMCVLCVRLFRLQTSFGRTAFRRTTSR